MFGVSITVTEARKIIEQRKLFPICNLWHYSFNIEYFYTHMLLNENDVNTYIYAPSPINQWAPPPIFTNDLFANLPNRKDCHTPFWFCRLTDFAGFLERRSLMSKKPHKHFPTIQTFNKKHEKLNGHLAIYPFNSSIFKDIYNKLRREDHLEGEEFMNEVHKSNSKVPPQWYKIVTLTINNKILGIGSVIDDGISQSLFGLASVINKERIGLYMLTLWIRACCLNGKKSVDSGISGTYGVYKDQLFLDSKCFIEKWW